MSHRAVMLIDEVFYRTGMSYLLNLAWNLV